MAGAQETGNETYVLGLLGGLQEIGFAADTFAPMPLPFEFHRQHGLTSAPSMLRVPLLNPLAALRHRLDLFHATYVLPPWLPCAGIVTVHDITFALHPEWFAPRVRTMLGTLVPASMRRARHVIAISQSTKRDIVERYGLPEDKVTVTHLAPPKLIPVTPERPASYDRPYFLYVGNVQPRKNVSMLLDALRILKERGADVDLVIAGPVGASSQALLCRANTLGVSDRVRLTGYVDVNHLQSLYAGCVALVHPALYEGFGLTPIEAMARGTPVLASNAASLPEVVGDAGLLLDPIDPEVWADSMTLVLRDDTVRIRLATRGRERAARFTWAECARRTVEVYVAALR
jgi:glycosyltransferase involved in cell wall biosynthesis